ncbi:hypothetical protein FALBO_14201 [Fusarium albosuccineum]|uniref:F-box domain-containing protein n=1 Tax=Fusarium albosuccineum TaxID=1237068 RepID=A0A8H4KZP4_9HYPO|nr:hypothetical protein FALBO_14201 [Fusarium albosuccineum]
MMGILVHLINLLVRVFQYFRLRPRPLDGDKVIKRLPSEVIIEICDHLISVDKVAFALTCRHVYDVCKSRPALVAFQLEGSKKFQLLQRLERDGVAIEDFLCSLCQKFHLPCIHTYEDARERARACSSLATENMHAIEIYVSPFKLDFDMVAAATRSHRHRNDVYSTDRMGVRIDYLSTDGYARVKCYFSAYIQRGRLIAKVEQELHPGRKRNSALEGVRELIEIFEQNEPLRNRCRHCPLWDLGLLKFAFRPDAGDYHMHECFWTQGKSFWNKDQPFFGLSLTKCVLKLRLRLALCWTDSCRHCGTKMKLSYRDEKYDDTTVATLTSWRDLGYGLDVEDPAWKRHSYLAPSQQ